LDDVLGQGFLGLEDEGVAEGEHGCYVVHLLDRELQPEYLAGFVLAGQSVLGHA
jgi:hypothetical protein